MATPSSTATLFDREFLTIRSRLIDLAASLDRIERAEGATAGGERREQIRRSLEILLDGEPHRAERIQCLFSLPYDPDWRQRGGS